MSADDVQNIIADSKLFDPEWYLFKNRDVARARVNPLQHYAKVALNEYRREF